jgi:2,3-bisphosphoglycerate-dependent phosphoglycerate mutase
VTNLILIRHSQTDARPDIAKHEWGLTVEGQRRAESLPPLLAEYQPFVLASSPEVKARQTAEPIARRYNVDVCEVADLREHDRYSVEWMSSEEAFRASVIDFFEHLDELVLGEETGRQALNRFTNAVDTLIDQYSGSNIVAVTHGSVITLLAAKFAGVDAVSFWQSLTQPWIGVFGVPEFQLLKVHSEFG